MQPLKRKIVLFLVLITISTTLLATKKALSLFGVLAFVFTIIVGIALLVIVDQEAQLIENLT